MTEEQGSTEAAGTKVCLDCAEAVQEAARVCRFCGYHFDTGASGANTAAPPEPPPEKSAAGSAILSLVIPGLGHFYLREGWRGGVFLAAFLVATLGAFATGTIGPGWIIGIIGAVDAYRGATSHRVAQRPREVAFGLWAMLVAVIALVTVAVVVDEQRARDAAAAEDRRLLEEEQPLEGADVPDNAPEDGPGPEAGADLQATLERLGFDNEPIERLETSSGLLAEAAATTGPGGSTGIVVEQYASPAEAREAEDDYLNALARPEGGRGAQVGQYLVFVSTSESEGLTESEISDFNQVVDALDSAQ